jgi:hypothetical protein
MNHEGSRGCWLTRRGVFLTLLAFLSLGVAAAAAAGQSSPAPGHAMGSAPCVWAEPLHGMDNALDVAATVRALQDNHFNCIAQVIENGPPNSFEDFKRLLASAQTAGISVWPVLIPPSEGASSLPYRTDYVGWMKEMAKLSLQYSALRGVNIDDLFSGISTKTFTRDYLQQIYQAKQAINPHLLFVPTVYDLDQDVADRLAGCVDGVWLWWVNLEHNAGLRTVLEDSRVIVANRFPIYSGVYSHQTTWHTAARPAPKILRGALAIGCRYADGAIIWNLPLSPNTPDNAWLATAREFAPGGSADLAGKCGLASTHSLTKPGDKE